MSDPRARKIRFLLETHHYTVPFVAEELGITRASLQEVLDERREPTSSLLSKLSVYFSVPKDFFGGIATQDPAAVIDPLLDFDAPPAKSSAGGKAAKSKPLDLRGLALRYQALIELLVAKGIFTAADYRNQVEQVEGR